VRCTRHEVAVADGLLPVSVWEPVSAQVTLVCVHGWTLDQSSFARQSVLAEWGVRVVSFDRRGFGANDLAPGLHLELDDIQRVIDQFPGPVYAFGVSQGARLLLRFVTRYPGHLAGLIVQGGLVDGLPATADDIPYAHYKALLQNGERKAFANAWLSHPLMRSGVPDDQGAAVADLISNYEGRDLRSVAPAAKPVDLTQALPQALVASPTSLWVVEAESESSERRAHARFLIEQCGGRAIDMPGGHLCHFTHAAVFNTRVASAIGLSGHGANGRH